MRLESEVPDPRAAKRLKTFGGAYHRLESTFRPAERRPRAAAQAHERPRHKPAPKPNR